MDGPISRRAHSLGLLGLLNAVLASHLAHAGIISPATPATATIEFTQDNTVEATIDLVSVLPGEQGNGLLIGFATAQLGAANPTTNVIGNAQAGYSVQINADSFGDIPYADILVAIDSIPEVSATLAFAVPGSAFDPRLQGAPPFATLSGGTDAIVPEPLSIAYCAAAGLLFSTSRSRTWRSERQL